MLLYNFNLCYKLMKKPLLERAMTYKKFVRQFQILQKKLKNSDIKTSEKLKNIKEKLSTFEFEFKLDLLER